MGRTNLILLALGLAGCVAMLLMAQEMMRVKQEHDVDPMVTEVNKVFGDRLQGTPAWRIRTDETGGKSCRLSLQPVAGVNEENLARDAGDYVWRRMGREMTTLLVTCDAGLGEPSAFAVPPPWQPRVPMTRVPMPADAAPPPPR